MNRIDIELLRAIEFDDYLEQRHTLARLRNEIQPQPKGGRIGPLCKGPEYRNTDVGLRIK